MDGVSPPWVPIVLLIVSSGATVSSVNARLVLDETFPLTSIWRTRTWLSPCVALHTELHVLPPSMLYWTVAPCATPLILTEPSLVMPSLLEIPVSCTSDTLGLGGAIVICAVAQLRVPFARSIA